MAFVQMMGKYRLEGLDPKVLETTQEWEDLNDRRVHVRPFWWRAKAVKDIFGFRTVGIRSYLSISEPLFKTFKTKGAGNVPVPEEYFGLWDRENLSLVVSKDDSLISYGSLAAEHELIKHIHNWVDLGMPNAASFDLKVYPVDTHLQPGHNEWIVKRSEAQFLWSLPESESGRENRR